MDFTFQYAISRFEKLQPSPKFSFTKLLGMAPEDECEREMFVEIDWDGDTLAVPLIQLNAPEVDKETQQAIAWHYWVNQGYEFG